VPALKAPATRSSLFQPLLQPNLDQQILRFVAFVGGVLYTFEHVGEQPRRDAVRAGFEVGKRNVLRLR
jgi:hypothetical protein